MQSANSTMRVLLFFVACFAFAAAATIKRDEDDGSHYDQRQNGTENYRVNVDGVLVAIAPVDALLSAASSVDFGELLEFLDYPDATNPQFSEKPIPVLLSNNATTTPAATVKVTLGESQAKEDKPTKRKSLRRRLANFLLPLLRRNQQN